MLKNYCWGRSLLAAHSDFPIDETPLRYGAASVPVVYPGAHTAVEGIMVLGGMPLPDVPRVCSCYREESVNELKLKFKERAEKLDHMPVYFLVMNKRDTSYDVEWEKLLIEFDCDDDVPLNRVGHTVILYNHSIYLYGGKLTDNSVDRNVYRFNMVTKKWKRLECSRFPDDQKLPRGRFGHSAVVYGNEMIVFGGNSKRSSGELSFSNCFYVLNLETLIWSSPSTHFSPHPSPRAFHTACVVCNDMLVWGGKFIERTENPLPVEEKMALWAFNCRTKKWREVVGGECGAPCPRAFHHAVEWDGKMIIYGGVIEKDQQASLAEMLSMTWGDKSPVANNEIHYFDPGNSQWYTFTMNLVLPPSRFMGSVHLIDGELCIFNGAGYPVQSKRGQDRPETIYFVVKRMDLVRRTMIALVERGDQIDIDKYEIGDKQLEELMTMKIIPFVQCEE